jgi:hypothetical protein
MRYRFPKAPSTLESGVRPLVAQVTFHPGLGRFLRLLAITIAIALVVSLVKTNIAVDTSPTMPKMPVRISRAKRTKLMPP